MTGFSVETASTTTAARAGTRRRVGQVVIWLVQIGLASQFVGGGVLKVTGDPAMVAMFDTIGVGQWLRLVVGLLEIAGAIGLLIPRLCGLAALGLAGIMIGAIITNVAVLQASPMIPAVFLIVAVVVAWLRRDRTAALLPRR